MEQKETIEQSLRRLEEIVERLGEETVTLDDSLALFAEGMKLSQKCLQQLEDAELIVEQHSVSSHRHKSDKGICNRERMCLE